MSLQREINESVMDVVFEELVEGDLLRSFLEEKMYNLILNAQEVINCEKHVYQTLKNAQEEWMNNL